MLNKVEVRNAQGSLLTLLLDDISNGYAVESIEGLDPVKATVVSSSFAKLDGSQYQSSRREERNIKIKIGLEPDYITTSVRDLRTMLYTFFMPKSEVKLRFFDSDGLTVDCIGRVETFESALFTSEPVVDISILCFDPDFLDINDTVINGTTVSTSSQITIAYDGSVDAGITFVLSVNRALSEFTIYHTPADGTIRSMDIAASFVSGDVLTISTIAGSKSVTLTRGASNSSLLYAVSPQSNWTTLQQGNNLVRVYAVGAAIPYSITYKNRYGGL